MNTESSSNERFAKIQALGNDFIWMLEPVHDIETDPRRPWITYLASERVGIGADGVILWLPQSKRSAELWFFNRDGSAASVCGNGLRAVSEAGCELGYFMRDELSLSMWGRRYSVEFQREDHMWSVGLGGYDSSSERDDYQRIQGYLDEEGLRGSLVYMPNPHVIIVEHTPISQEKRETIATELNECVPGGTNVGFFTFQEPNSGFLAVWERGVGWTPACGSGAAAVLRTCMAFGLADTRLEVNQPGGSLRVEHHSDGLIWITGSAGLVYTGMIRLHYEDDPPEDTWGFDTRRGTSLCV